MYMHMYMCMYMYEYRTASHLNLGQDRTREPDPTHLKLKHETTRGTPTRESTRAKHTSLTQNTHTTSVKTSKVLKFCDGVSRSCERGLGKSAAAARTPCLPEGWDARGQTRLDESGPAAAFPDE